MDSSQWQSIHRCCVYLQILSSLNNAVILKSCQLQPVILFIHYSQSTFRTMRHNRAASSLLMQDPKAAHQL